MVSSNGEQPGINKEGAFEAHHSAIIAMNVSHRLMYTASVDGTAKCWVTEHGDNTVIYKGHELSVTLVRFYKGLGEDEAGCPAGRGSGSLKGCGSC